jgi:hypothetical protein
MEHRHGGLACADHTTGFSDGDGGRDERKGVDRVDGRA